MIITTILTRVLIEMRSKFVVSAINLVDGGPLTVLRDAIVAFDSSLQGSQKVIFLVSDPQVHEGLSVSRCVFKYFPKSKKSWFIRLFYEYVYFYFLSINLKPDVWVSLHDVTPNVRANVRYVYCHNPAIFLNMPISDILYDVKMYIFSKMYKYVYAINIRKNKNILVQQGWIAKAFSEKYSVNNVLVSRPDVVNLSGDSIVAERNELEEGGVAYRIFYPAYPRYFKNHRILYELAEHLAQKKGRNIQIFITVEVGESRLIKALEREFPRAAKSICYLGRLSREEVELEYKKCDALVFPSLLETWGLPIIEIMRYKKPILLADLPYANETVGAYEKIYYFNPLSVGSLVSALNRAIDGADYSEVKLGGRGHELNGWAETVRFLINE